MSLEHAVRPRTRTPTSSPTCCAATAAWSSRGSFRADVVARLNADLDPHARRPAGRVSTPATTTPSTVNTMRIQGLPAKSRTFVDEFLLAPDAAGRGRPDPAAQLRRLLDEPGRDDLHRPRQPGPGAAPRRPQLGPRRRPRHRPADLGAPRARRLRRPRWARPWWSPAATPGRSTGRSTRPTAEPVEMEPGLRAGLPRLPGPRRRPQPDRRSLASRACTSPTSLGWLTPEEAVPMSSDPTWPDRCPRRARELLGFANLRQRGRGRLRTPRPRWSCGSSTPTTSSRPRRLPPPLRSAAPGSVEERRRRSPKGEPERSDRDHQEPGQYPFSRAHAASRARVRAAPCSPSLS